MSAVSIEAGQLLTLARALTAGSGTVNGCSPRAGCLVARQAFELTIDGLLEPHGLSCRNASMQTRLICLHHAYGDDPTVAYRATTLWSQLSSACHHHAYELDPSARTALGLIDDVQWLLGRLHESTPTGSAPKGRHE